MGGLLLRDDSVNTDETDVRVDALVDESDAT